jgi:hypothetical protein
MSGMLVSQESCQIYTGGNSLKVALTTTSAASAVITGCRSLIITTDSPTGCFLRQGDSPTALSNGTDQYLPPFTPMRLVNFYSGNKIAGITASGSGNLYITPEA